jgi:hypothetical protein
MENNERDRKLDQWLDEALSEYSAAEPRLGLEQRVLNRVRAEEQTRSRRWSIWKWMPAFAAIAAAVIIGVAIRPMRVEKATQLQMSATLEQYVTPQQNRSADQTNDKLSAGPKKLAKNRTEAREADKQVPDGRRGPSKVLEDSTLPQVKGMISGSNAYASGGPVTRNVIAPAPLPPPPAVGGSAGVVNQPRSDMANSKDAGFSSKEAVNIDGNPGMPAADASTPVRIEGENIPLRPVPPVPSLTPGVADTRSESATVQGGIVGTEKVTVTAETGAFKKMKASKKERERAENKAREDANFIDVFGVRLRTEIKQSPAGPMQFPTPAPLSEQEKLVLAAAKKMKDAPVKQDAQGGAIPAVEIKEIEIKPLEGPKK